MTAELQQKEVQYFDLLLKFCLKTDKILFISCDLICSNIAQRIADRAKCLGVSEVVIFWQDARREAEILRSIPFAEVSKSRYFDFSIWNTYAQKNAAFLILKTEIPGAFAGVDETKIIEAARVKRATQKLYREKQHKYEVSWTIAILPNQIWAQKLYPEDNNPYEKFYDTIFQMCMVGDNTIEQWQNQLKLNSELVKKLNNLEITSLHYRGDNGTDLHVKINPKALWMGADKGGMVVNMPTYEVFTFPDSNHVDGIIYSSRPLYYNGVEIDDFRIEFKDGKAVSACAAKGEHALRSLIACASGSNRLGEIALVDGFSPIAKQNKNFGITLLDENAACHFALGNAYPATYVDYINANEAELVQNGFNVSSIHVDFMVGYKGLDINADTNAGKVQIIKNGAFVL